MGEKFIIPKHLRRSTRAWVKEIIDTWSLETHQFRLLCEAGKVVDRILDDDEIVRTQGAYYQDNKGVWRAHPCVAAQRADRRLLARLLRELSLSETEAEVRVPGLRYGGRG